MSEMNERPGIVEFETRLLDREEMKVAELTGKEVEREGDKARAALPADLIGLVYETEECIQIETTTGRCVLAFEPLDSFLDKWAKALNQ